MTWAALREGLRAHRGLTIVVAAALILRIAMLISYPPAFISSEDSLIYMAHAWLPGWVGVMPDRPSGYPIFVRLITPFGHSPGTVVAVQHLLGLGLAVLAYFLLLRQGVRRWLALAAAAVLALDAYSLTMEHWVLTETLATFLIFAALGLTVATKERTWPVAIAGLLLAFAITCRTVGMFVIPVWLVYLLWAHRSVRVLAAGLAPLIAVLAGYMAWHQHVAGTFRMVDMNGWFLYARVGKIGTCGDAKVPREVRPMCPLMLGAPTDPRMLLWGGTLSPAYRVFGGPTQGGLGADPILRRYAIAIIRDRPWTYTRMVGRDMLRYFDPGEDNGSILSLADLPTSIPAPNLTQQRSLLPGYRPRKEAAAGLLAAWSRVGHVPRPLLGLIGVLAMGFTLLGVLGRRWLDLPRRREAFLFLGTGWLLVLSATATSGFILRYMLLSLPLLLVGIALAAEDAILLSRAAGARSSRAEASSGRSIRPRTATPAAPRSDPV